MLRTILIVDDVFVNRKLLKRILSGEYEVLEARDGEEALAILQAHGDGISAVILDLVMPVMDGYELIGHMRADTALSKIPIVVATSIEDTDAEVKALSMGANDYIVKPYNVAVIRHRIWNAIDLYETAKHITAIETDKLTGLYNRETFFEKAEALIKTREPGYYVLGSFDVDNFKVVNDQYGNEKGDEVLQFIAKTLKEELGASDALCCRIMADNFAALYPQSALAAGIIENARRKICALDGTIQPIALSVGQYIVEDKALPVSGMYDRATLAVVSVKGRYDANIAVYDESMRTHLLREQEITGEMKAALETGQFEIWFQPQCNHSSGALVGAEALVRWRHPEKGVVPPNLFVPVFEKNGFIYEMDRFIWEKSCQYLRKWLDEGQTALPVSVNVSRYDLFREDVVDVIEGLVRKYSLPPDLMRLEITESAFAQSGEKVISVVKRLIERGITIEIHDFGSGYSSLNTLKDVPAHVLKLDMRFLENDDNSQRGGNVLESIVRMARWLGMSVIAEGVEAREQADFLESIGCAYIQGYLYARPMPAAEYERFFQTTACETMRAAMETVETLDNSAFWNPKSMDTLIFNSFVGGACIFEFHNGHTELLRANRKYAQVLGGADMTLEEALTISWHEHIDDRDRQIALDTFARAIETNDEQTSEVMFVNLTEKRKFAYFRMTVRVIARTGDHYLFYCMNEDITKQRVAEQNEHQIAERLQAIMDNVGSGVTAAVITDGKIHYLFSNDRYYEIFGYTRAQYEEAFPDGFGPIHPEDIAWVRREVAPDSVGNSPVMLTYRAIRKGGEEIWLKQRMSVAEFAGVEDRVQLSIFDDITSEKRAELMLRETSEQMRFLNYAAHDLLSTGNAEAAINSVLTRVLSYFDGDRAYVIELDYERRVSMNTYEVCAHGVPSEMDRLTALPFDASPYWFHAFENNDYISIENVDDMDEDRAMEKQILREQGIRSLVAVPLVKDGTLSGFIGVDDPRKQFSHVSHLQAVGDYLVAALTRRDLNARIENDNKTLKGLMDDMPGGFARIQLRSDGAIESIFVNNGLCRLLGMTSAEIASDYRDDLMWGVHPDDATVAKAAIENMLKTGEAQSAKYRLRNGEGGYIWVTIFGRMTTNSAGASCINIYYTDMTPRSESDGRAQTTESV